MNWNAQLATQSAAEVNRLRSSQMTPAMAAQSKLAGFPGKDAVLDGLYAGPVPAPAAEQHIAAVGHICIVIRRISKKQALSPITKQKRDGL